MPDHVLLAVHAHPDDESMGTGGTLARYAAAGVETVLVCATRGEEGEIQNPDVAPSKVQGDVARIRMKELEEACDILGIRRVFLLGYRDSGMEGSADNQHPDSLYQAPLNAVAAQIAGHIQRLLRTPGAIDVYHKANFFPHCLPDCPQTLDL